VLKRDHTVLPAANTFIHVGLSAAVVLMSDAEIVLLLMDMKIDVMCLNMISSCIYVTASREYRCSHTNAKSSIVFREFSLMQFRKVGRCASEEITVELMKMKCLPILFYSLEFCLLNKSQMKSLDFETKTKNHMWTTILTVVTKLMKVRRSVTGKEKQGAKI